MEFAIGPGITPGAPGTRDDPAGWPGGSSGWACRSSSRSGRGRFHARGQAPVGRGGFRSYHGIRSWPRAGSGRAGTLPSRGDGADSEWLALPRRWPSEAAIAIDNAARSRTLPLQRGAEGGLRLHHRGLGAGPGPARPRSRGITAGSPRWRWACARHGAGETGWSISAEDLVGRHGELGVPDAILHKPGASRRGVGRDARHPSYAVEILGPIDSSAGPRSPTTTTTRRGKGGPLRTRGRAGPAAARIFAAVDIWDALATTAPIAAPGPSPGSRAPAGASGDPPGPRLVRRLPPPARRRRTGLPTEPGGQLVARRDSARPCHEAAGPP